jgi:BMFP domain-containing protein YqiC
MLSQLILETQEELAYLEQKIPRLRARLSSFQQLYGDLQRKTRKDINDADEENEVSARIDDASDEEE